MADREVPKRPRLQATIIVGATLVAVVTAAYVCRTVVGPLLLAAALAYILEPLVRRLQRSGLRRGTAVGIVFGVGVLVGLSTLGWLLVGAVELVQAFGAQDGGEPGAVYRGVQEFFAWLQATMAAESTPGWLRDMLQGISSESFWRQHVNQILAVLKGGLQGAVSLFGVLGVLVLMPLYLVYLMLELESIWAWLLRHLPAAHRPQTLRVLDRLHVGMAAFLRGRVVLAFGKGLLTALGLVFCGTPLALVVGLGAGILSILPFLGPLLGFVIAMALTLSVSTSFWTVVGVILVFAVAEVLENFVLLPLVMKSGADLHPLTVLFCVVFWGAIFGAFGAFVAIPLTLIVKVLLQECVMPSVRELAAEPAAPAGS